MSPIIILNGASSSGKSTLAKALQSILPEDYLLLGVDTFMHAMPRHFAGVFPEDGQDPQNQGFSFEWTKEEVTGLHLYKKGEKLINAMYAAVACLVKNQQKVMLDDMIFNDFVYHSCKKHLETHKACFVQVYTKQEVRRQRELARGDRLKGTYKINEDFLYQKVHFDIKIDNSYQSPEESALALLSQLQTIE